MRQIILSTSGALLARVPRPAISPGSVLVRVHYSLISTGTELAPLREQSQDTRESRVLSIGQRGRYYATKAIRNPRLAFRRIKEISRRKAPTIKRYLSPAPALNSAGTRIQDGLPQGTLRLEPGEQAGLSWDRHAATELKTIRNGFKLQTNGSPGLYQAISQAIAVPAGHRLTLMVEGEVAGASMTIGALSGDRTKWLCQLPIADAFNEVLAVDSDESGFVWITWTQAEVDQTHPSGHTLTVNSLTASIATADDSWPAANEMNDLGWGVGYSAAGEVVAVGEGIDDVKVGDLVACGGAEQANHAEYISVKRRLVTIVPRGCGADAAATTTVGTIALQGIRRTDPKLGETICVVGLGLLGLITCQMLIANGCKVLGIDPSEERTKRALELGVENAATTPQRFLDITQHATGGHGADATIITAAAKTDALVNHAMETTRRKGRVVIVGDVGLAMERSELYRKEIDVLISTSYGPGRYDPSYEHDGVDYPYAYVRWTQNRNMEAYLELIRDNRIDIRALIDKVVPISNAADAYQLLLQETENQPVGVLIDYGVHDAATFPAETESNSITLGGHRGTRSGRIRYVLVGAGAFGTSMLVPQMDTHRELFDLRGVVSQNAVRGGNFARQHKLEILASDIDEILIRDDIDLVVISTRHDQHAMQTAAALRAGKHVFVEKPLALTWNELTEVQSALEERPPGTLLMVGFNRRFAPAMLALRDAVKDRICPLVVNYRLNGGYIPISNWIQGPEGGGRNLGEACHMYDIFRALTGAPAISISASGISTMGSSYLVNDNFIATLTYGDGSIASLTYAANGPKTGLPKERIEVFSDGKGYVLDDFVSLTEFPSGKQLWSSRENDKGHSAEFLDFGNAISSGSSEGPIALEQLLETTAVALHIEDLLQGRV